MATMHNTEITSSHWTIVEDRSVTHDPDSFSVYLRLPAPLKLTFCKRRSSLQNTLLGRIDE